MKKIMMLSMSALIAIALALPAIAARPEVPTEPIKMALGAKEDKHVVFNHDTHATVDCAICHHEVDGVENYAKCSTAGCHNALGTTEKGVDSYYRIAHDRKLDNSCLGCHVKEAKAKPKLRKALTGCKGSSCHP